MYILLFYLLFLSFFIPICLGKWISYKSSGIVTTMLVFFSFLISVFIFFEVGISNSYCEVNFSSWINVSFLDARFDFIYDSISVSMLIIITFVSFFVHLYSIEYMKDDPHQNRFFSYISLFTFFMVLLVTSGNLLQLFIGWEGVGIVSYLLINFWYGRIEANKSSILAILLNKIGDLSFLLSMGTLFVFYGTCNFSEMFSIFYWDSVFSFFESSGLIGEDLLKVGLYLMVVASMAKSAQLGFHMWLPEAMEGPTPVSSLIHAATMVTAGVFLLIRCSFLIEGMSSVSGWILFIGSVTAFFGGSVGMFQHDIKKIVAYSTCSQLGYMFLSCGICGFDLSEYHLINHAFFKALLFLSSGMIIHSFVHEQDFRKMGGLYYMFPLSLVSMVVGSLSLMGFPFFSGFFSKDLILDWIFSNFSNCFKQGVFINWYYISFFLSYVSVLFTCIYSLKLIIYVFFHFFEGYKFYLLCIDRGSFIMMFPILLLSFLSIGGGFLLKEILCGWGTEFWTGGLRSTYTPLVVDSNSNINIGDYYFSFLSKDYAATGILHNMSSEFFFISKNLPLFWVCYIIACFIFIFTGGTFKYDFQLNVFFNFWANQIFLFFNGKWLFFDKIFIKLILNAFFNFTKLFYFFLDKGLVESIGPFGATNLIQKINKFYAVISKGVIYHYLGFVLVGFAIIIHEGVKFIQL
uniref:NADH-ubiquinone oxidoreductase chain 5 n=1 Tax=Pleurostomum flabellatum TaxID=405751 RepID=A0A7T0M416_9EUKA|nr:NADH dehydrogenase subunit 5 [Pleurostomum flabellatum]QPL15590.1 NADH dehydrogenase subunit 5 [Pleurostomum flabellatum]